MGNTCTTIQVQSGDSCASLATRCGIPAANFTAYNPSSTLCSTLTPGEHVCCSSGSLPDYTPSINSDGSCYAYYVNAGLDCSYIAANYSITVDEIEVYNNNTWGWLGCADLQAGTNICLSPGTPPFPSSFPNVVCGPQVPNTTQPTSGTVADWALLNPCPLNACCDVWGECGTTAEFCTPSNSSTKAPGTAAPGTNGCISNCGTEIVTSGPPAEFFSIGYFEAFGIQRACLNMNAYSIKTDSYTHIHYAFGNITSDFNVNDGGYGDQFQQFLDLPSVKKVISFGGWTFSTDPSTYMIFREGVLPANSQTLAQNVVNFVVGNGLDGVDFDWEYPGEPDIRGIPAGSPDDGTNYLAFLQELRSLLPAGNTISVAAPASYWYLKGFPIADIAKVVDYIVFMTYDLHGIWDEGNSYSQDGCPGGNCLRSDINMTETQNALSMITKAGVPSNKIMVGTTSYGRTFTMSTAGCWTSECTYTEAGAAGECTQTAGYLANAEINEIIATDPTAQKLVDAASNTTILIYNETQWVGYMDTATREWRNAIYQFALMGGTSEWAVDLEEFVPTPDTIDIAEYGFDLYDCNKICLNPLPDWGSENITAFAYCGAAYIDTIFRSGTLNSPAYWTSYVTQTGQGMTCSSFPADGVCPEPNQSDYCDSSSIPAGKFQALYMAYVFYANLQTWNTEFEWSTINATLNIPTIVDQFPAQIPTSFSLATALSLVGGGLSTLGGIASYNPEGEGIGLGLSSVGGIIGMLSSLVPDPTSGVDMQSVLGNYLSSVINATLWAVGNVSEVVFTTGTLDNIPSELTTTSYFQTPLASFLYNSAPVILPDTEVYQNWEAALIKDLQRGLVGAALGGGNYYILKNVSTEDDCSQITGAQPYGGYCYSLQRPGVACDSIPPGEESYPIDNTTLGLMTGTGTTNYGINMTDLIGSSEACQNQTQSYLGSEALSYSTMTWDEQNHPPCFYNLPILYVQPPPYQSNPCAIWKANYTAAVDGTVTELGYTWLPPNLDDIFTQAFCTCQTSCSKKRTIC